MKYYIFSFCFLFSSCTRKNAEIETLMRSISSHRTNVPFEKLVCINIPNTIDDSIHYTHANYKVVEYINERACAPCTVKGLAVWNELLYMNHSFSSAFIIEAPSYRIPSLRKSYMESGLDHPVYIDTCHAFMNANPHITDNALFHTFLLDENDSIKIIGNPIRNEKIKELYKKILSEHDE